ncbi:FecR family protein [Pedobacter sp. GR22-6]|uniref:FecR family protein n=1 Tax=Pedobacter sp. GR22-6 TaxID=3127957 RepID=UPI00307F6254
MADKDRHQLRELIAKSEEKRISEQEQILLDNFIKQEFDAATWNEATMGKKEGISEYIYQNIRPEVLKKPLAHFYKYAIAASMVVLLTIGIVLNSQTSSAESLTFSTESRADSIKLADGSMIYLAANSTFKYPSRFDDAERSVTLVKGDAFFKVNRDPEHPFVITSNQIRTKVLGTSFHISLQNKECRVTVVTGKVNVSSEQESVDLLPEEEALYNFSGLKKQSVNRTFLGNWYQRDVELSNVTVAKVLRLLTYRYGVSFETAQDEILDGKMTIYIKGGLSLQNILDQINYITHLKFRTHDETVTVTQ